MAARACQEGSLFDAMARTEAFADFEDLLDNAYEVSLNAGVGDAKDGDAQLGKVTGSLFVMLALGFVDAAVDLDCEAQRGAVEVDDIAGDDVLPTEPQTGYGPPPQPFPEQVSADVGACRNMRARRTFSGCAP